jgi:ABC-type branched-subunit amino acid transport system substrate-binding protein
MSTYSRFLVLLMPTLMFGAILISSGCLGGDDDSDDTSKPDGPDTTYDDTDGDGIYDVIDQCAGTPEGVEVDWSGCPLASDSDGDGVVDEDDDCPDSASDADVDASGCQIQYDSDGDGVADGDDACPATLAGIEVDAFGCEVIHDSDGDGVVDADDDCADTPAGIVVDGIGCPVPQDSDGDGVLDADDDCPDTLAGIEVDESGCEVFTGTVTEVKLGVLTPRTGANSDLAEGLENAAQMAIDEINAAQSAYNFTLVFADSESSNTVANHATWGLTEEDGGVSGIIGGSTLGIVQGGIAKPVEHQVPLITPFVSSGGLDEVDDDGLIWRVIPSEADSANAAAMWSNIYELSDVGIIHVDDGFGRAYARIYTDAYGAENICHTVGYPSSALEFSEQITAISEAGCDNILVATYASDGAMLIDDIAQAGFNSIRLVSGHHPGFEGFPELLEDKTAILGMVGGIPSNWTSPLQAGFDADYLSAFNSAAPAHAGASYDATMIMAKAVIQAGSTTGSDVKAAIPVIGDEYAGIVGTIDFDQQGNTPGMKYDLFRFETTGAGEDTETYFEQMGYWSRWDGIESNCRPNADQTVIGMLSPRTGIHAAYAQGEENGVQLGIELLNINQRGLCFSMTVADTQSTEAGAASAMQALVNAGVIGVIGPHSTEEALGALPIAESSKIPIITYGAFSDEALIEAWDDAVPQTQDYGWLWRVAPGADLHAAALAAHISNGGYTDVAILHDDGKDNTAIADALDATLSSTCSVQSFAVGQADMSAEVSALSACDAVVILAESNDAAAILAQLYSQSSTIARIGGHGMGDLSMVSAVSDPAHLAGLTGIRMGIDHELAEFDHELKYVYNMNYGGDIPAYASWAGDATLILGTAAATSSVGGDVTGERINKYGILFTADEYGLSSGEITLDDTNGHTSHTNMDVYSWSAEGLMAEIGQWREDLGLVMF